MTDESAVVPAVELAELAVHVGAALVGDNIVVHDITEDSRRVTPGSLFVCRVGDTDDGHDFASTALASGAVALVTERPLDLGVPELRVSDARAAMAPLAAALFGHPAEAMEIIAITGTNGKTTVSHLVASIFTAAGRPAVALGTLSGWSRIPTSPQPPDLHRRLASLRDDGTEVVALEVSSQALAANRVDGIVAQVAVFTNLSRDHLDLHGSMDAYFQAKARLFTPERAVQAVVNLDDPHGRLLSDAALVPTTGYSMDDVTDLAIDSAGSTFRWRGQPVSLALVGSTNVVNAVAAATAASALGLDDAAIAAGLGEAGSISGRFERVGIDAPFDVIVDYAHTPDALAHLLDVARELAGDGQVHLVFGCGGDKDVGKRAPMGEVAAGGADQVLITSDNPRSEDPEAIIDEIRRGMTTTSHVQVEVDRRKAISRALATARPGDVVVVAGKGHETTQVIGDRVLEFHDPQVVADEYARLVGANGS